LLLATFTVTCNKDNIDVIDPPDNPDGPDDPYATYVLLNKTSLYLSVNEKDTLIATLLPSEATNQIFWSIDNQNVATVNDGLVIAHREGLATITARTDNNVSASCKLKVYKLGMVLVEGGTFVMGCTNEQGSDCYSYELPNHNVTVSSFKISRYPVTQKEWVAIMGNNPSYYLGDFHPVEMVSWEDVQQYIKKLNVATGKKYRLATEAEWEFAARGGNKSNEYKYSGSSQIDDVAWYDGNSSNITHPVGSKIPNELGIYDMNGNVWEWCSDWFGAYLAIPQNDPHGPATGTTRIVRGGCWYNISKNCRVSTRYPVEPKSRLNGVGFRLAHSLPDFDSSDDSNY